MKDRADIVLYREGYVNDIKIAQSYIMQGIVLLDDKRIEKAGEQIEYGSNIRIKGKKHQYVSRGGLKIEKAIKEFNIDLKDKSALDIGASTGGFTDCMLKSGAKKVFAVDVGYGQLAWSLQSDSRVIIMDRTNIKDVTVNDLNGKVDFITADVSFISLKIVLPIIEGLLNDDGSAVILIKPQFEARREEVGLGGIVKEKDTHIDVIERIFTEVEESGLKLSNFTFSPITGATGNIEFLAEISKNDIILQDINIKDIVELAHIKLSK